MKRRKPKRKQKLEDTVKSGAKLDYAKYRIEWFDIASDSGWASESQFDKMKLAQPVNEGWVYEKTKDYVKVFASYDKDEEDGIVFGDRTMIPLSCVRKMTKLN